MLEQSDIVFIKLLTQKSQGISYQHPCEETANVKANQDVIRFDPEGLQCVDEIL